MFRIPSFLRNLGRVFRDKAISSTIPISRGEAREKVKSKLCALAIRSSPHVGFIRVNNGNPTRSTLVRSVSGATPAIPTRRLKSRIPMPTSGTRNWTSHGHRRSPLPPQFIAR